MPTSPGARSLRPAALVCLLLPLALTTAAPLVAQERLDRPLRVYLDCSGFSCDLDYYVEEVPWVDFVRDRQDADVHVLGTRESTGGGGSEYTMAFLGRGAFEDQQITLRATTESDATEDMRRSELVDLVRRGLAPFAAATSEAPRVEVLPPAPVEEGEAVTAEDDPWNRWSFQVSIRGFLNGESQQRFLNSFGNVSASRVTETWKLLARVGGSLNRVDIDLTDTHFTQESFSGGLLAVRSLGEHWAAGGVGEWRRSTFGNYEHSALVAPAVEYNIFPYSESNRRLLTFLYGVGVRYNDYTDVTIFDQTVETLLEQNLVISYDVTQPWGSVDASVWATHFVTRLGERAEWPDPQYNVEVSGGFEVRLVKGLSLDLGGRFEMVRGQIHLPAAGLTEEEILTRQRELATNYRYFFSFGLSYRFGSIFTSVVNPRFGEVFF